MTTIYYSVVIPMKNEVDNVRALVDELESVMASLNKSWELIIINDGSTDGTKNLLIELQKSKPFLNVIHFKKNRGQSSGFAAGFQAAQGEFVITMDGDRQNDPHDIPKLLSLTPNADLVCGIRRKRKDSWLKRIISKIANFVRSRICQDGVSDTGCSLKIMRRSCLSQIKMYEGMHRFLPALFKIEGFQLTELEVNHRERSCGKSHYNLLNRSLNTVIDMFAVVWMRRRHLYLKPDGQ